MVKEKGEEEEKENEDDLRKAEESRGRGDDGGTRVNLGRPVLNLAPPQTSRARPFAILYTTLRRVNASSVYYYARALAT